MGWLSSYKVGKSWRAPNNSTGDFGSNFASGSNTGEQGTKIWLMGDDGTNDSSSNIANQVNNSNSDQNLQLMNSASANSVSISGIKWGVSLGSAEWSDEGGWGATSNCSISSLFRLDQSLTHHLRWSPLTHWPRVFSELISLMNINYLAWKNLFSFFVFSFGEKVAESRMRGYSEVPKFLIFSVQIILSPNIFDGPPLPTGRGFSVNWFHL